jgi:Spo7-like protein
MRTSELIWLFSTRLLDLTKLLTRYVPHANRALRSFNMYFNVRKPSLRSKISFNPLSFFFPRPDEKLSSQSHSARSRSPSPTRSLSRSSSASRPIPSIPPATNPRGELIFSRRIDKNFRESYERYRSAFQRRREEKERAEWRNRWLGKLLFWRTTPSPGLVVPAIRTVSSSSSRGKSGGSRSGTPPTAAGAGSNVGIDGIVMKQRERGGSSTRQGSVTPPGKQRAGIPYSPQRERGRRELIHEGDMRTFALERSLSHGGQDR